MYVCNPYRTLINRVVIKPDLEIGMDTSSQLQLRVGWNQVLVTCLRIAKQSSLQSTEKSFRIMFGFKPEKMTLNYLYNLFFDTMRKAGNMPYTFSEKDNQLEIINWHNKYYKLWLFNSWFCIAFWLKHVALLARCH